MIKPKVLVTRPSVPVEALNILREKCDVEVYDHEKPIERDVLLKGIQGKDALFCLLTDPIDKAVMDAAGSQLKAIATMSVGYDHIDTAECKARGIQVSNTPDVSTDSVAEHTVTLMLAAGRRLIDASVAIKQGEWEYAWSPLWLCGQGLTNAVVGIVGMGRIGQGVMKRVLPFGVSKVLYFDVFHPIKPAEEMGAVYVPFEELCRQSDFIVAMCNLSEDTRDLFNAKAFKLMKPSAVFVNTSRGGVVNQEDLYDALKNQTIRAAGIDVMVPEPLPRDHPLTTLHNLIVTPHVGSSEISVRVNMAKLAAENILAVLEGKPMITPVSLG